MPNNLIKHLIWHILIKYVKNIKPKLYNKSSIYQKNDLLIDLMTILFIVYY